MDPRSQAPRCLILGLSPVVPHSPASFRGEHWCLDEAALEWEEGSPGGGPGSGVQLRCQQLPWGYAGRPLGNPTSLCPRPRGELLWPPGIGEPPRPPSVVASLGQPWRRWRAGEAIRCSFCGAGGRAGHPSFWAWSDVGGQSRPGGTWSAVQRTPLLGDSYNSATVVQRCQTFRDFKRSQKSRCFIYF